jgi:O-antigen ligase
MIVSIFIGLIILYICWVKPMVGIAILVQINLIRAVFSLDFNNLNFRSFNEPDAFLGAIIPILGLITIFLKLNSIHKKIKFKLSFIDVFFLLAIFTLIFSTIFSSDVIESIVYTGKFIFLAFSYYFTSKTVLLNTKYPDKQIIIFLKTTLFLGIALGIISLLLLFFQGVAVNRLTIPGVHPIPYSQLMGFSILVIFSSLMIDKKLFFIELGSQFIRGFLLVFLLILLFASNTKGILLSVFLAMLIMLYLKGFRINKKLLLLVGLIIIPLIFYVISVIGYESLFDRLLRSLEDDSVNHRVLSYVESFQIFRDFPLTGSGPGAYGVFGFLDYPHNFFLENMAQYGVLGILMNSYFIFSLFIIFWISNKAKSRNFIYSLLFIFIIYFFVETMVSFTLWMHKGLYVTLGLFSGYYFNKIKTNKKSIIEIIKTAESNVKYE